MTKKQRRRAGMLDKISSLPSHILAHILSFLSPTDAVKTSVLSKKWKYMWIRRVPAITPPPPVTVRWADAPNFLLLKVLSFSDLRTSVPRFRAVCRSWRSSLSNCEILKVPRVDEPCHHPNFLGCMANVPSNFKIPDLKDYLRQSSIYTERYYLLTSSKGGQAQAPAPWLVRAREYEPNKWKLLVPYDYDPHYSLIETNQKLSADINLLDCGVQEMCNSWYVLAFSQDHGLVKASKKVVGGWDFEGDSYVFTVLIHLQRGTYSRSYSLHLLRLDKEGKFKIDELDDCFGIYDIAHHNKKFYIAWGEGQESWQIGVIDPQIPSIQITHIAGPDDQVTRSIRDVFFLPSDDNLFLLIDTSAMYLYPDFSRGGLLPYVLKQHMWERVNSFGDNIFFIARHATFCLPPRASRKLPWKPGSVCFITSPDSASYLGFQFMHKKHRSVSLSQYPHCFKVYNPEDPDKETVPFTKLDPTKYTGVFYPPPHWVKWNSNIGAAAAAAVSFKKLKIDDDQEINFELFGSDTDEYNSDEEIMGYFYNDD